MAYYFCLSHPYQVKLPVPLQSAQILNDKTGDVLADLTAQGLLTIYPDYAWDGCSPRFQVFGLFWLGVPNGISSGDEHKKPIMYYPSLVHDVLLQMFDNNSKPYSKQVIHKIFLELGQDFPLISLYYWAVKVYHWFV